MGTKISALTETGSAPTGAYYPLEYDNANYKISTETLRANLGGKYVADWATSHGGTTVAKDATLTITHNLWTDDVVVQVFVANDASGTNAVDITQLDFAPADLSGYETTGAQVQDISTTELTIQLGEKYIKLTAGSYAKINFTNKFLKVVVNGWAYCKF